MFGFTGVRMPYSDPSFSAFTYSNPTQFRNKNFPELNTGAVPLRPLL